jgi:hypothetical protein
MWGRAGALCLSGVGSGHVHHGTPTESPATRTSTRPHIHPTPPIVPTGRLTPVAAFGRQSSLGTKTNDSYHYHIWWPKLIISSYYRHRIKHFFPQHLITFYRTTRSRPFSINPPRKQPPTDFLIHCNNAGGLQLYRFVERPSIAYLCFQRKGC